MMTKNETQRYLKRLYMDITNTFDEMVKNEIMDAEPMRFNEYMKQYASGLKMLKPNKHQAGGRAEEFIRTALSGVDGVRVTKTTPAFDNCYGADFKVLQDCNGKPASVYVDIKLDTKFDTGVTYLSPTGTIVDDVKRAGKFPFSFGTAYFGIKSQQRRFFKYEKPVVVMYVSRFTPEIKDGEMNTLAFILSSINRILVDKGYSYRVSQFVIPNYTYLNK